MTLMICLANSFRDGGRCVAGVDLETAEWIRPVPPGGGAIPVSETVIEGRPLSILDVVELTVESARMDTEFQRENRVMPEYNWRRVTRLDSRFVIGIMEQESPILFNYDDKVYVSTLKQLPPNEWRSLQLVWPSDLDFQRDSRSSSAWRANFSDSAGCRYSLRVTDPEVCERLQGGKSIKAGSLLTISLTLPWLPRNASGKRCHKLVAGVIEV
jgi:hypothetical protein